MSSSKRRIGLLTGTFDPVHLGHVAMGRVAMRECVLDEVWFLVNPEPGHKVGVVGFADRLAMVRLAVGGERGLSAYSGELADKHHNIDVFLTLIKQHPTDQFVFIVGTDVLGQLGDWEDSERVLREAQFAVARRERFGEVALDSRLKVSGFDLVEHAKASSRAIRSELRAGKRPVELDERVYAYVRERGLYGA